MKGFKRYNRMEGDLIDILYRIYREQINASQCYIGDTGISAWLTWVKPVGECVMYVGGTARPKRYKPKTPVKVSNGRVAIIKGV